MLGVTAGVVAISVAAVAVFELLPRVARHPRFQGLQWLSALSSFEASPRMATQVFALCLIRHVLNFVTFGLLYQALSPVPGAFLAGGLVYALTSPVRMVNITPGNLGVTEWFVALIGKMLAFDLTTGLIVALALPGHRARRAGDRGVVGICMARAREEAVSRRLGRRSMRPDPSGMMAGTP